MKKFLLASILSLGFMQQIIVARPTLKEKAQGAIIGAAYGDALGRITEFIPTTAGITQKFGPQGATSLEQALIKIQETGAIFAPYTDDTVMAKIVLETALKTDNAKGMLKAVNQEFAQLFGKDKLHIDPLYHIRAHGITNSTVYGTMIPQSNSFEKISQEGGCGSVMRAWPIGLAYAHDLKEVAALADKQSALTHRHPMARAASAAMAVGVARAYLYAPIDTIVHAMIQAAETYDKEELTYKTAARKLNAQEEPTAAMLAKDQLLTSDMIRYAWQAALAGTPPALVLGTHNNKNNNRRSTHGFLLGWSADEAVAAAVYIFVRHAENLKHGIIEGVNTPGDSDSIASLAGALIGANTGLTGQLTEHDYQKLENKDLLMQLAEQAAQNTFDNWNKKSARAELNGTRGIAAVFMVTSGIMTAALGSLLKNNLREIWHSENPISEGVIPSAICGIVIAPFAYMFAGTASLLIQTFLPHKPCQHKKTAVSRKS